MGARRGAEQLGDHRPGDASLGNRRQYPEERPAKARLAIRMPPRLMAISAGVAAPVMKAGARLRRASDGPAAGGAGHYRHATALSSSRDSSR